MRRKHTDVRLIPTVGQLKEASSLAECSRWCFIGDEFCLLASWSAVNKECRLANAVSITALFESHPNSIVVERLRPTI